MTPEKQMEWMRRVARQTRLAFILFEVVAVLITGSAVLDQLVGLGWGYSWTDALMGLALMLWGAFVYWVCRIIFRWLGCQA